MFCSKCGSKLEESVTFCSSCGNRVALEKEEIVVQETPSVTIVNAEIKEYLEHAKTLEVNRYTLMTAIDRLQEQIESLGHPRKHRIQQVPRGTFGHAFFCTFLTGVVISLIVGGINMSSYGNIVGFIEPSIIGGIASLFVALIVGFAVYCVKDSKLTKEHFAATQKDEERVADEKRQIIVLQGQQNEMGLKIREIAEVLEKLYSLDVIYPKYRELLPIVTMCEYMDSGRCSELIGPNGAYNLYESESRQDIIISNLSEAVCMLAQIRDTQYALYEAIQESNAIAEAMCNQLGAVVSANRTIEKNSEMTAFNSKVAAENSAVSAYIDFCKF